MTGRVFAAIIYLSGAGVVVAQQPAFRTQTVDVTVNVSVQRGNVPVAGLTSADFEVTDNGIPQRITDTSIASVPVDTTIVLDTSGSAERMLPHLNNEARRLVRELAPPERFRLLTIGSYAEEIASMRPVDGAGTLPGLTLTGASSIYDTLAAAMMARVELGRRHLVVLLTDGRETMSSLNAPDLLQVARRSEALVHILLLSPASTAAGSRRVWIPYYEFDEKILREVARTTGGELHDLRPDFSGSRQFRSVMQEFRRSYTLRYTATGVSSSGWHEIAVRVRGGGNYRIRARRGYSAS